MKNLKRRLILRATKTTPYRWLLLDVLPYIRFTCYYTSFKGWMYQRGYQLLEPGQFLLTNDRWKLTSLLVPGEWTHAAFCVARGTEFEIAEMTHTNFTHSTFFDLCKEATRVAICDCYDWDQDYKKEMIARCLSFDGTPYDVSFENGVAALYCSELVYVSDFERRLKASTEDMLGLGMPYVSPDDLWEAPNRKLIWDSANER